MRNTKSRHASVGAPPGVPGAPPDVEHDALGRHLPPPVLQPQRVGVHPSPLALLSTNNQAWGHSSFTSSVSSELCNQGFIIKMSRWQRPDTGIHSAAGSPPPDLTTAGTDTARSRCSGLTFHLMAVTLRRGDLCCLFTALQSQTLCLFTSEKYSNLQLDSRYTCSTAGA